MDQKPDPIQALTQAFDKMTELMFTNFDARIWGIFGIVAFFMNCGRAPLGSFTSYNNNLSGGQGGTPAGFEGMLIAIITIAVLIGILILAVSYYLGSKAEFSIMSKIATGNHESRLLFMEEYDSLSFSLMKARIAILFVPQLITLLAVVGGVLLFHQIDFDDLTIGLGIAVAVFFGFIFYMIITFVGFIINNYAIPIMFAKNQFAFESIKEGFALFFNNIGPGLLFMLIKFALSIAGGILTFLAVFLTFLACCVGCIPILGAMLATILVAPVFVLYVAYAMYFIQSHGTQYHMFGYQDPGPYNPNPGPPYGGGQPGYGQPDYSAPQLPDSEYAQNNEPASRGVYVQPTMEEYEAQQQLQNQFSDEDDPSLVNFGQQQQQPPPPDQQYQQQDYDQNYPDQQQGHVDQEATQLYDPNEVPPPLPPQGHYKDAQTQNEDQNDNYQDQGGSAYEVGNDDDGLPPPPPPLKKDNDGNPYPPPPPPPVN